MVWIILQPSDSGTDIRTVAKHPQDQPRLSSYSEQRLFLSLACLVQCCNHMPIHCNIVSYCESNISFLITELQLCEVKKIVVVHPPLSPEFFQEA
jgi:hypothetical protein